MKLEWCETCIWLYLFEDLLLAAFAEWAWHESHAQVHCQNKSRCHSDKLYKTYLNVHEEYCCQNSDLWKSEFFKSIKVRVLQRIENKHENYSSALSLISQTRIWVYENFYRQFSETLNLSRVQVTYDFQRFINLNHIQSQEILHELHVILLVSSMMLKLNLLNI